MARLAHIPSYHRPIHLRDYKEVDPASMLHNPHFNKFTAFTMAERDAFGLRGLLPSVEEDINIQSRRCYAQYRCLKMSMSKYIYLTSLRSRNETLFYKLIITHLEEMLPFIYTPTVGDACLDFSLHTRQAEGMFFCKNDKDQMLRMLSYWRPNSEAEIAIIVLTDGSRILGLGDLGAGGMAIPIGKLSLYVAAGGFHPSTVLPITFDSGTDNESLRNSEFYMGQRHPRLSDNEYFELVDELLTGIKTKWPTALVQFEDFSNNHCFNLLEMYREKMLCFNDDIQGTGSVIAAGFLNALKIVNFNQVDKFRVVMVGAGAAATGVAHQISRVLQKRYNMTNEQTRDMFYMVDSKGLVCTSRGGELPEFKKAFARTDIKETSSLEAVIETLQPQAVIGLSCCSGIFTTKVLKLMAKFNEKPIVFALSNPTCKAECSLEEAVIASKGSVIFASGSPFDDVSYEGKIYHSSQGNNLYCFPGIGFGAWIAEASIVTDSMIDCATLALADTTSEECLSKGQLYPPLSSVRNISVRIATTVALEAYELGIANANLPFEDIDKLSEYISDAMYVPQYLDTDDDRNTFVPEHTTNET